MGNEIKTLFVEKKPQFRVESKKILNDFRLSLNMKNIEDIRILNRYNISGVSDEEYNLAKYTIFSEKTVDDLYEEKFPYDSEDKIFGVEYLPGQYDQRADSAAQCIQILTQRKGVIVKYSKIFVIKGNIAKEELERIKEYCINKVDSREAQLEKPNSLQDIQLEVQSVEILHGFIDLSEKKLKEFLEDRNLAMTSEDLKFCQEYFRDKEKRNPTITEIKVIDTYWSDHCRHTTFMTEIEDIKIEEGLYSNAIKESYETYKNIKRHIYAKERATCLMDIATIAAKELREKGLMEDLDVSPEINACSIVVDAEINGKTEKWIVMFKNETHNHPTEIEPFGGAATCVGGAIRDPLSGRVYVYQAMRVTGSADPRQNIEDTLEGKLPQKKITTEAAHGYSSYGNQIGLATGQVAEIYDEGYVAKRMEIGAVIGAATMENVIRKEPKPSDIVILLGGRTGRDGIGGATGSSKKHTESSIENCGSEVQKGNAPTERKIQRFFRNKEVSTMIKRCNDFGAGGVAVAIGELTEGLYIDLNKVPKKYDGLDGTELSISESQERMAVVISKEDRERFIKLSAEENLEATVVAEVKEEKRLKMLWKDSIIVDLDREFLNTNGVVQKTKAYINTPEKESYFQEITIGSKENIKDKWIENIKDLNVCSQKGLVEMFDSTVGAGTVVMPLGGKYQKTPQEGMAAKLPVLEGDTTTATVMTYGFNPKISKWSPFHGAMYAVIESVTKAVAMGIDYKKIRLTFQEYFEKLENKEEKWGKPLAALLGALKAQREFSIAAIGGKDSMSGTFKEMNVPPTLVSFAVGVTNVNRIISSEFKEAGSIILYIKAKRNKEEIPDFNILKENYEKVYEAIETGNVLATSTIKSGGISEAISKMCFGNNIGAKLKNLEREELFSRDYGSIILEVNKNFDLNLLKEINYKIIGDTTERASIEILGEEILLDKCYEEFESTLEDVFISKVEKEYKKDFDIPLYRNKNKKSPSVKIPKPKVLIPVFPGTNCEYDSKRAFEKAGGEVELVVFNNMSSHNIKESIDNLSSKIKQSNIIMLPGGFSAGDEPEGSGKFIATIFRNEKIKDSVMELLKARDGLMLGICNGFQALIKLGLVPFGEIRDINENCPTLTYNDIGRHQSKIAYTKVVSNLSPWFNNVEVGDIHAIPISHGEGKFYAKDNVMKRLIDNGQIVTQYVDVNGNVTSDIRYNPNGSISSVEGICSPDGRILGKMAHSERIGYGTLKNVPGNKDQKIFDAGIKYFK
ncbi:phosphoribosylformylglycinamidine synthase [Clostridium botulinum]|uniref:Phosphoribosylformylglycinamidine synthase n=1 Tax=Clostridium botulinum (strain Kyoto / Type A2) TaxID=536232 RepID=C1FTD6_CLOBJ|nr:phosphoribosylformylglycinamidine synthase [Clostridium botulinum]ACO83435.1 phosphoribosylformylglycinamidine synthase [Clostridium botulinum A2 str. Kyoto]APH22053.1 phosphoribosylformylglycinamidine synthase [Clostridium botulinum]APQ68091.1 phosphoribosylformylglycinamidine synthase [Clostridium botulinum]AUN07726.1 phosphoribosylformylglycinamidine synthase [Clostridium botulinum]EPS55686.1 phosphoribosylformylglycinamidine synthase [Clostridium botulinum Af84]